MEIFLGIIIGVMLTYWFLTYYQYKSKEHKREAQAVILIEKIKSVCKLITVEGDFAEIYHYEDSRNRFLNMVTSKKKAILLVNATVHIGFDLSQIKLQANNKTQEIVLTQFPEPKVLTIETDVKYYDKKEGFFNKFEANDLTELNQAAKQFIVNKIPESGLLINAKKEAFDTILMIEKLIETSGWKLNYTNFSFQNKQTEKLN
jgi:hypothetical protein